MHLAQVNLSILCRLTNALKSALKQKKKKKIQTTTKTVAYLLMWFKPFSASGVTMLSRSYEWGGLWRVFLGKGSGQRES